MTGQKENRLFYYHRQPVPIVPSAGLGNRRERIAALEKIRLSPVDRT
jgi:hypothetical protein